MSTKLYEKMKFKDLQPKLSKILNRKVTQQEVADALELDRSSVNKYINSEKEINSVQKIRVEQFFEINLDTEENYNTSDANINMPVRGDISASLGAGSFVNCETVTEYFPLPKSLMKKIGASPEHSCIINTSGESMYPTIIGGQDLILIDESKKEIFDGKIYLIRMDNSLFAKRLQKLPQNRIKVISDNPDYDSYIIDLKDESVDFAVIGKIMWISRIL